jgi:hypothetical protein
MQPPSRSLDRIAKSRKLRRGYDGEKMNAYTVLTRKPLGKCPLGSPKRRSENKIKMDLRSIGCEDGS